MKISIKSALKYGLRAIIKNSKFLILFWGTNAVAAFILSMPIYYLLIDNLNNSLMSDKLALGFDYIWFIQFANTYRSNIGEIPFMIFTIAGVYLLIQIFYIGGLISIFNFPEKNHMVDFFFGGVKYWLRFTRLVLVSLLFFVAAFIVHDYLGMLIEWGFAETENQMADFIIRLARYTLLVFFIGLITLVSDYSKVYMAVEDSTNVFTAISQSLVFTKNNLNIVFTVFLTIAVIGALGAILYNIVELFIPRTPFYFLLVSFILQQMLIIFRLFIRMYFCATEVILYKDLSADVVEVKVKEEKIGVV